MQYNACIQDIDEYILVPNMHRTFHDHELCLRTLNAYFMSIMSTFPFRISWTRNGLGQRTVILDRCRRQDNNSFGYAKSFIWVVTFLNQANLYFTNIIKLQRHFINFKLLQKYQSNRKTKGKEFKKNSMT